MYTFLKPTGKVIRQRKGHISLWYEGGRHSGMLQGCNEVRLRILYPLDECTVCDLFAIKRRHIMLQQQSQPLSMVNNIVYS